MSATWRALAAVSLLVAASGNAWAQIEDQPGLRELEAKEKKRQEEATKKGRLTKMPHLIHQVTPVYPEAAKAEKRSGGVVIRVTIDAEGYVARTEILQSAGADLDEAAMVAVCNFVFEPAEVDDIPAPIQLDYKQTFTLAAEAPPPPPPPPPADEAMPEVPQPTAGTEEEKPVNFVGVVRESGTKKPLADAEVSVDSEDGELLIVTTDTRGRFQVRGVTLGERLVRVSLTGYEAMATAEMFEKDHAVQAIYYIPRRSYNKFETTIRDRKPSKEVNRVVLRREEVSEVAGSFGDPLRVIENMPGMARAPLLGGQLLVRGASPQDTGVYMDGVEVPLLYHFGGLTSVVNAQFLETIDFYPGGFGATYGRATAGIVDVKSRSLKFDGFRGVAKVDLFDSGFFFGGPVTLWGDETDSNLANPRRITFGVAARRSYIDAIIPLALSLFLQPGTGAITIAPVYWDYQAKLEYHPFSAHRFQLFTFGSDDTLKVIAGGAADGSGFGINSHTQFHRLVARWTWRIAPRLNNTFQAYVGLDRNNVGIGVDGANLSNDVFTRAAGVRNELHYDLLEKLAINLGMDFSLASTQLESDLLANIGLAGAGAGGLGGGGNGTGSTSAFRFVTFPRAVAAAAGGLTGGATSPRSEDSVRINMAPYVETEIGPFLGLKFVGGFRFDYYEYGQGKRYFQPNPRLSVRYEPVIGTVLKASYGVYDQLPQPAQLSPTTGNPDLTPERARHYIIGAEQKLTPFLGVNVNAFYVQRLNRVALSTRYDIVDGEVKQERYFNSSEGRSYGLDFMLRYELSKNFFGWIAYTLSRSENKTKPNNPWALFTYDQTHILTVVGQYKLPWHLPFREWARTGRLPHGLWWNSGWNLMSGDWSVGGRFRYVTGNPANFYAGSINDLDRDRFLPTGTTSGRLPAFHQLDIRVDYKMAFDSWLVDTYVDFINVYNRQNPEAILWDYRYQTYNTISILPFLPIVGVQAEF